MTTTSEFLATRENQTLTARKEQLSLNFLGVENFKAYLKKRLTIFPNETKLDFNGGVRFDGQRVEGRVQYTPLINYLNTIVTETNNFTFFNDPERVGGDPAIINNINGNHDSVDVIMREVNSNLTIAGWGWIKVDMPANATQSLTLAQKDELGIRPFWTSLSPFKVVDWDLSRNDVNWVLEEDYIYDNSNPLQPTNKIKVRRLWEKGKVTIIKFQISKDKRKKTRYDVQTINTGFNQVPFVLIGTPSVKSHNFDIFESINKNILDLESSNKQIFLDVAFPQQFISENTLNRLYQEQLSKFTLNSSMAFNNGSADIPTFDEGAATEAAFKMATGTKRPMVLAEGESPHVAQMPTGLSQVRDEITIVTKNLMEQSGILLSARESNLNVSGLSKAYDLISIQSLVNERSRLLENGENQAVEISNAMDPDFTPWTVDYNSDITPVVATSE